MRELTFRGVLNQYVRQLSVNETSALYKLAAEASSNNPRLREPLRAEYDELASQYTVKAMAKLLKQLSPELPVEYHKVWHSYQSRKNKWQADNHTKELMHQKLKRLQMKTGVTNYRIYAALKLNLGNLNAWLKYGNSEKVGLNRRALRYVERAMTSGTVMNRLIWSVRGL